MTPRLGFVGTGWIGLHRMRAVAESGLADIVAVVEPDRERARAALSIAPEAERRPDLDSALAAGLDGVVIATPSALHGDQAIAALEAGAAVFCQKPLGRTEGETRAVVESARRRDLLLAVDLCYRHTAAARSIRALLRRGALGRVHSGALVFHNAYGPDKDWFYEPALSGGGCVIDLGIHLIDLVLWLLDFPAVKRVDARLYAAGERVESVPLAGATPAEDVALARLDLAGGASFQLACSWNLHAGRDAVIGLELYGTRGGAALRNVDGSFYDLRAERYEGTRARTLAEPPDDWMGRAILEWTGRLAAGEGHDPEVGRAVAVARAIDRIYGREVHDGRRLALVAGQV